jgi:hypothetical protein
MNTHLLAESASILAASASPPGLTAQPKPAPPSGAGTEALLFKDDPQFWFEISRLFGAADYGGCEFSFIVSFFALRMS